MADDAGKPAGPFDVPTVEALVHLMAEHNISEIDLRDGIQRVRLRRGARKVTVASAASVPAPAPLAAHAPPAPTAAPAPARKLHEIKSNSVGTFYSSPNPESPPFVRIGSRVELTTVVGIIDVMKTMNEFQAECSGVITEVLVENGTAVEFNQVLFRVDPG